MTVLVQLQEKKRAPSDVEHTIETSFAPDFERILVGLHSAERDSGDHHPSLALRANFPSTSEEQAKENKASCNFSLSYFTGEACWLVTDDSATHW